MPKPRLLYYATLRYAPENLAVLDKAFDVVELARPRADTDEILATVAAACAPLGTRFDADLMDRCPRLSAILSNTTGVAHIDMDAAAERGIEVFSLADEPEFLATITSTAEHAFGLMLALLRRIPWSYSTVLVGNWNRFDHGGAAMLSRMSLGIVGLGRLGRLMARYGEAFGMDVRYFDPHVAAGPETPERCETLAALVATSDVVSLHVPADESTRHMINAEVLDACRAGAVLVNTARGEVVDEAALIDALENGPLAGAALDVQDGEFAPEFTPRASPLVEYARRHDNLLITPHIGGSTEDAWRETQRRVIDRAVAFFAKKGAPKRKAKRSAKHRGKK